MSFELVLVRRNHLGQLVPGKKKTFITEDPNALAEWYYKNRPMKARKRKKK